MESNVESYKKKYNEDDSPGLDAINFKIKELYGSQKPTHWATVVPYELGGKNPLWAVECYINENQGQHFHYITFGFTNLWYDEGFAEDQTNGFGFELTFRYSPLADEQILPSWPSDFLQNIARYVFKSGKGFNDFHYMSANGPIRTGTDTEITAFAFYTDKEMGEISSPHGNVKFLQVFGITTREYNDIRQQKYTVKQLLEKQLLLNPLLVTNLKRK